jgi:hypothetical protein
VQVGSKVEGKHLVGKVKVEGCLCEGWKTDVSEKEWWNLQSGRWGSRLPDLVKSE